MAKVKYVRNSAMGKTMREIGDKFIRDKDAMKKAALIIRSETLENVREGFGVDDSPLPSITPDTVHRREDMEDTNKTHSKYTSGFSNATFTGEFLNSYDVKFKGGGSFTGQFKGKHAKYKNSEGESMGKKQVKNSAIASGLSSRGWELYGITKKARQRILQNFLRYIKRRK